MTYDLMTNSHGEIKAGYSLPVIDVFTIGQYVFMVRDFCQLLTGLAEKPDFKEATLLVFPLNNYGQRLNQKFSQMVGAIIAQNHGDDNLEQRIEKQLPELVDAFDLENLGTHLPVRVSSDCRTISIGEYEIVGEDFGYFAAYIVRGGLFGFLNKNRPDFIPPTIEALMKSVNPLVQSAQTSPYLERPKTQLQ